MEGAQFWPPPFLRDLRPVGPFQHAADGQRQTAYRHDNPPASSSDPAEGIQPAGRPSDAALAAAVSQFSSMGDEWRGGLEYHLPHVENELSL